jgi:hypothetical protein
MISHRYNENTFLQILNLPEGGIAVFDKGINRYKYFDVWTQNNRFFVTRLKDNAKYEVIAENSTEFFPDILKNQRILPKYRDKKISRTVTNKVLPSGIVSTTSFSTGIGSPRYFSSLKLPASSVLRKFIDV